MKAFYYILLVLVFAGTACKKKQYPKSVSAEDNPFYMKLVVDGQALEINAGKNNYYMYSSIARDSSKIYSLVGEFKQSGCSTCPNSLRIQIVDSKTTTATTALDINSVLSLRDYHFVSGPADTVLSKVILQFTDANGLTFTSNNSAQEASSVLRVISIEDSYSDVYNKSIKKVKLNVNCKLFNGSQFKFLQSAEIVLGLVY